MRRLVLLTSAVVLFDVTFYSVIAPLLPDYAAELGSKQGRSRHPFGFLCGGDTGFLAAGGICGQPALDLAEV